MLLPHNLVLAWLNTLSFHFLLCQELKKEKLSYLNYPHEANWNVLCHVELLSSEILSWWVGTATLYPSNMYPVLFRNYLIPWIRLFPQKQTWDKDTYEVIHLGNNGSGVGKWDEVGKEVNSRCIMEQVTAVGNARSRSLESSGRWGRTCLRLIPTKMQGRWSTYSPTLHLPLVKDCFWGIAPTLPAWHTHTELTLNNKNPSGREPRVCTASHQCCVCSSAKSICVRHSPCQIHRLYANYATAKLKPMLTTSSSLFHHQWLFQAGYIAPSV